MVMKSFAALAAAMLVASAGNAAIVVDGEYDAAYGAPTANVTAPFASATDYSIYLKAEAGMLYGYLKAASAGVGPFTNLYFDLDPANDNGSDLGFEITNDRAFVPGIDAPNPTVYSAPLGIDFKINADKTAIEFALSNALFTGPISGLTYYPGQEFADVGGNVTLRISQSFNYEFAQGATFGADRLGSVTLADPIPAAVPEPASWAMMVGGFGLLGGMVRRRRAAPALA